MFPIFPAQDSAAYDLAGFRFAEAVALGQVIRGLGHGVGTQQQAAQRLVELLYDSFRSPSTGAADTVLVRCFKTHEVRLLPVSTRTSALAALPEGATLENLRCLTLLGTRGQREEWNQPQTSEGHWAIPLPDVKMIERAPMIFALLTQMGVDAEQLISPSHPSFVLDGGQRSFNVFHVEEARGSDLIPAQQTFVLPYGIRSVVGMGGLMPNGELFAVILFARVPVSREVAELFRTLALSVKLLFLPFGPAQVFADEAL